MTHTFANDFEMVLISPDGDTVRLTEHDGGTGDDFTNTCFSPTATIPSSAWVATDAPYTGSFLPDQPFSGILSGPANGLWQLKVTDEGTGDLGTLNDWTLSLNTAVNSAYSWSPEGSVA